jgi:hypothetical protein
LAGKTAMALNKPTRDNARKAAVKKRTQLATQTMGKKIWTKAGLGQRRIHGSENEPAKKKFKGARRERA